MFLYVFRCAVGYGIGLSACCVEVRDGGVAAEDDFAADYARMMNEFSEYLSGANTIEEAEAKLQAIIKTDKMAKGWRGSLVVLSVGRESIPHMTFVNNKEPTEAERERERTSPGGYYKVTEPEPLIPIPLTGNQASRFANLLIGSYHYDSVNAQNGNWINQPLSDLLKEENQVEDPNRKKRLTRPRHDKHTREMPKTVRDGDVTPEQFKKEFGFADVGFGTWVAKGKDQAHLNGSWDAFADMADAMGMDRRGIGFFGVGAFESFPARLSYSQ